jgi:hypothetical protein
MKLRQLHTIIEDIPPTAILTEGLLGTALKIASIAGIAVTSLAQALGKTAIKFIIEMGKKPEVAFRRSAAQLKTDYRNNDISHEEAAAGAEAYADATTFCQGEYRDKFATLFKTNYGLLAIEHGDDWSPARIKIVATIKTVDAITEAIKDNTIDRLPDKGQDGPYNQLTQKYYNQQVKVADHDETFRILFVDGDDENTAVFTLMLEDGSEEFKVTGIDNLIFPDEAGPEEEKPDISDIPDTELDTIVGDPSEHLPPDEDYP